MRQVNILFIFLLIWTSAASVYSQVLPDQIWVTGITEFSGQSGNVVLKFQDGQVEILPTNLKMNFESTVAAMPDSLGNLLFYTNGCYIANATGDTMENGDGLNPGEMANWTCPTAGYIAPLGAMILPLPGKAGVFYLFHMGVRYTPDYKLEYGPFYYTVIDMHLNGGKGGVISKNNMLSNGSFEPFSAVRHGNGRDWWLVFPEYSTNRYHKFLFSPAGVQELTPQEIGAVLTCRYIGSSAFSPNGTRYARQQHCGVVVSDFDRCSGNFSNTKLLAVPPQAFGGGGVAFNSTGDHLFMSTQLSVQVADLSLQQPVFDTIVSSLDVIGSSLHLMQRTPIGTIMLSNLNRGNFYHVMTTPEDQNVGFEQRGFNLPVFSVRTLPNLPNFRLFDLADSECDTLAINAPMVTTKDLLVSKFNIWPNPVADQLNLSNEEPIKLIKIYDVYGKPNLEFNYLDSNTHYSLDVSRLLSGIYFLVVRSNEKWISRTFIKT